MGYEEQAVLGLASGVKGLAGMAGSTTGCKWDRGCIRQGLKRRSRRRTSPIPEDKMYECRLSVFRQPLSEASCIRASSRSISSRASNGRALTASSQRRRELEARHHIDRQVRYFYVRYRTSSAGLHLLVHALAPTIHSAPSRASLSQRPKSPIQCC